MASYKALVEGKSPAVRLLVTGFHKGGEVRYHTHIFPHSAKAEPT